MSSIIRSMKRKMEQAKPENKVPKIRSESTKRELLSIADMWARAGINRGDAEEVILSKLSPEVEWTSDDVKNMCALVEKHHLVFDQLYMAAKRNIAREMLEDEANKIKNAQHAETQENFIEGEYTDVNTSESKEAI